MNHRRRENGAQNVACAGKGRFFPWVSALCIFFLTASPLSAAVLPSGGNVTRGSGTVSETDTDMTITQTTDKMIIEWQDFSIGEGKSVTFDQPSRGAAALNRVIGSQVSEIRGALKANGRVFLVNPNGVLFGRTAQVNVGDLVVSTLDISDEDFLEGNYSFEGDSPGSIVNGGDIEAAPGGSVVMIAARIENAGTITAPEGNVLMGAGRRVLLDLGGPVKLEVKEAAVDALIEQGGAISADGGLIYISAEAAGDLQSTVINHTGITEARTLVTGEQGGIYLMGGMNNDRIEVGGTLDASAPEGGDGGFVETSAAEVKIKDDVKVTTRAEDGETGTWLIDPKDFTIAPDGEGDVSGETVSVNLESTNMEYKSLNGGTDGNGDIFVNDTISWSKNTLTLNAYRNIEINEELNGSGTAQLSLWYGQGDADGVIDGEEARYIVNAPVNLPAGENFFTKLGESGGLKTYMVIMDLGAEGSETGTDLQGMSGNLSGNYALGSNIDASATAGWNSDENGGFYGFDPIGNGTTHFTGTFDGLGHVITDLYINRPEDDDLGFFGYIDLAKIRNIGFDSVYIAGKNKVGGLAGLSKNSIISNSYTTGSVKGGSGGLVGWNYNSTITHCYSIADSINEGSLGYAGGLVGLNDGRIVDSYATGSVTGGDRTGGLVGQNRAIIRYSYATGDVTGYSRTGGLVGWNSDTDSLIEKCYATGLVEVKAGTGGGLAGSAKGSIVDSYWDKQTTGQASGIGNDEGSDGKGIGLSTEDMMKIDSYVDWDISNKAGESTRWRIYEGNTYPLLRSFLTPAVPEGTVSGLSKTYDGTKNVADSAYTWGSGVDEGEIYYAATEKNAGTRDVYAYSTQKGYDITLPETLATVLITRRSLEISGITASNKTYDGTTVAEVNPTNLEYGDLVKGDDVSVSATGTFSDKNVGTNKTVSLSSEYTGADVGNYHITDQATTTASINPLMLTLNPEVSDKIYDGTPDATITGYGLSGFVDDETVTANGGDATFTMIYAFPNLPVTVSGVTLSDGTNGGLASNYTVPETVETTASIDPKELTLDPEVADKTYDGTTGATVIRYGVSGLVNDDIVTVNGTAAFADKNAGVDKEVFITDISLSDEGSEFRKIPVSINYTVADTSTTTASILRRVVAVAADPKAKEEGRVDPVLTYQVEAQQGDRGVVAGETLNGSLTREAGEGPGIYEILQGNLHNANNPNYDIWYTPADFTITEADTGLPEPVQDAVSTSKQDISNSRKATNALVSRYREAVRNKLWGDRDGGGESPETGGGQRHWTLSLGEFLKLRIANRGIRFPEWMDAE